MTSSLAGLVLSLIGLQASLGEAQTFTTPETVLSVVTVSNVALSPDGSRVLYRAESPATISESRAVRRGALWTSATKREHPELLTDVHSDATRPAWAPDGQRIAWIGRATSTEVPQVFVRDASSGEARVITAVARGVDAFVWSPDGTRIAFSSREGRTRQQQQAFDAGEDWTLFGEPVGQIRLHIVELAGGRTWPVTPETMSVHYFAWSPNGERLALIAAPTPSVDDEMLHARPFIVDARGGEPERVTETVGWVAFPSWSPDGTQIAWLGSAVVFDPWYSDVWIAPADGKGPARNLTAGYEATATWLGPLPGQPNTLALIVEEKQATTLQSIDLRSGARKVLAAPNGIFSGAPSFSSDGRTFAATINTPTHPNDVFVARRDGTGRFDPVRRLTRSNPQIDERALGSQEIVRWKSRDGLDVEGVLIKPVGFQPGKRYPVIVHVHGGSEGVISNGWRATYNDWGQLLAARGYVVIYPNYRGSRGRGLTFISGNRRDMMGREWEDIESALDHVIASGLGDPTRAGIYGFSWGGYAAGWGATFASHRFKAAVGGAGIYNWISEAGSNESRWHEQRAHWDAPLYEHFNLYLERSPIFEVRRASTPLLMLHGELDQSCPVGQAIEMHTALKWKGVPVELVIYPREGHGMRELPHQRDFLTRGLGWFDRHLQ
jgi:dipeptidyl aminopeptidase/acylaminoacyl peptidase